MTRKELQTALRQFRDQGLTTIKLNAKNSELQAEYDRLTAPKPDPKPTAIVYHFADMVKRAKRPPAKGFATREKRYDQLTLAEWRAATLAFIDDDAQPMMMAA